MRLLHFSPQAVVYVIIAIAVACGGSGTDEVAPATPLPTPASVATPIPSPTLVPQADPDAESQVSNVPEFTGISGWINSEPLKMADLRGKVVLVDFWTYTCINCIRTMPFLREWHAKYAERGLTIIGVHTPEFDFEHVRDNVVAAARLRGLEYPIAQDNDYATWTSSRIDSGRRSI